jgi:hypothetical protein
VEVREVAVTYHLHHEMFYHMVQDQFYRLLALVPYLRQHPDIHIFLYGRSDWAGSFSNRFLQLCGISKYTASFLFSKHMCLVITVPCCSGHGSSFQAARMTT